MPMPTPMSYEDKETFVSRCIMELTHEDKDKFPDRKQRAAICYSQWNAYAKEHGKPLDEERANAKRKK